MTTLTIDDQKFTIEEGPIIEGRSHTIRTIKDMLTVVNPESLDDFIIDLKQIFQLYYSMKEYNIPVIEQFDWIDDGKHDINVNYTVDGTIEEKQELLNMIEKNDGPSSMVNK